MVNLTEPMTEELHYSLIHPLTAGATLWNTLNHLRSTPSYGNIHLVWDQEVSDGPRRCTTLRDRLFYTSLQTGR